jgi:hypothetical protein
MQNNPLTQEQIIEKICNLSYPIKEGMEKQHINTYRQSAAAAILTLLSPFIPKWVSGFPEKSCSVLMEDQDGIIHKGSFIRAPQGAGVFVSHGAYINAKRYQEISTEHPFELLLKSLQTKQP